MKPEKYVQSGYESCKRDEDSNANEILLYSHPINHDQKEGTLSQLAWNLNQYIREEEAATSIHSRSSLPFTDRSFERKNRQDGENGTESIVDRNEKEYTQTTDDSALVKPTSEKCEA